MKTVGITGGIGAGKSTVCHVFQCLGIPVYNADNRAKSLMKSDENLKQQIIEVFGDESYIGTDLNREFLANKVFGDNENVEKLNDIVHPAVKSDFNLWVDQQSAAYVIKEAALLIESGGYMDLEILVSVYSPEAVRIQRVLKRDPFRRRSEIDEIIKKQTSDSTREELSDYVITNDENKLVIPQVMHLHSSLIS